LFLNIKQNMKNLSIKFFQILTLLLLIGFGVIFFLAIPIIEGKMNGIYLQPPYKVSNDAANLHERLLIADLHADPLLWGRNLLERGSRGHIDIPRLIEGNVALQVFSVVTKVPQNLNIEQNDDLTDNIYYLNIVNLFPLKTWNSLKERALYHALRFHQLSKDSNGKFIIIKSRTDLENYLERRKKESSIVAGLLASEGAHILEGDPANIDVLFDAGYRMISPTHFFDNEMGGSAHGMKKGGLTEKGKEMIQQMEKKGMIVDLAHASKETINEILEIAKRPVIVSHTGVKGTCNNNRNLSDEQLKAIAANGGLIGIGYWEAATCGTNVNEIVKAIRYSKNLIGVDHIALGSDYDGAATSPFDVTGLVLLTETLIQQGFTELEIQKIMGENEINFFLKNLTN
jgi:membrane dipeptidase